MKKENVVLIYGHNKRAFNTTLIGYLYLIANEYKVVLITDALESNMLKYLEDKSIFPNLIEIIYKNNYDGINLIKRLVDHCTCSRLIKKIFRKYNVISIIGGSDYATIMELYLFRMGAKNKIVSYSIQSTVAISNKDYSRLYNFWRGLNLRNILFIPKILNLFIYLRNNISHFLHYIFFPILSFSKPFLGYSSHILMRGNSGMRDSCFQIVMSTREKNEYIKDGVSDKKLLVFNHPLQTKARSIMLRIYSDTCNQFNIINNEYILILLPAENTGIKNNFVDIISENTRISTRFNIIKTLSEIFYNYKILIKPHPNWVYNYQFVINVEGINNNIFFLNKNELLEGYLINAKIVFELPRSASTALLISALIGRPAIAFDLDDEYTGDFYKFSDNIILIKKIDDIHLAIENITKDNYKNINFNLNKFDNSFMQHFKNNLDNSYLNL